LSLAVPLTRPTTTILAEVFHCAIAWPETAPDGAYLAHRSTRSRVRRDRDPRQRVTLNRWPTPTTRQARHDRRACGQRRNPSSSFLAVTVGAEHVAGHRPLPCGGLFRRAIARADDQTAPFCRSLHSPDR
jgi:hypothetical protein